jgi:hypothetical protein
MVQRRCETTGVHRREREVARCRFPFSSHCFLCFTHLLCSKKVK